MQGFTISTKDIPGYKIITQEIKIRAGGYREIVDLKVDATPAGEMIGYKVARCHKTGKVVLVTLKIPLEARFYIEAGYGTLYPDMHMVKAEYVDVLAIAGTDKAISGYGATHGIECVYEVGKRVYANNYIDSPSWETPGIYMYLRADGWTDRQIKIFSDRLGECEVTWRHSYKMKQEREAKRLIEGTRVPATYEVTYNPAAHRKRNGPKTRRAFQQGI